MSHHLNSSARHPVPTASPSDNLQPALQALAARLHEVLVRLDQPTPITIHSGRPVVRAKVAIDHIGLSKSHFWAIQNPKDPAWDATFPRSFKLGDSPRSATVWFLHELDEWLRTRAAASRGH